ncbi:MAG: outer membrane beta-barrel protein [Bacteroidetes bacterium]|nr:outer membrane beta-barrel protein [Bacteroidota bacterium]
MNSKFKIPLPKSSILRLTLLVLFLFLMDTAVYSQNDGISGNDFDINPNLHLGIKAGLGFSNMESAELTHKKTLPGMSVGLYGNYLFGQKLLLQIELNGNLKGANFSFTQASSLDKLSLFYLDMPVIVHYVFIKNAKLLPFIGFQPSVVIRKDAYKTQEVVPQPISVGIKKYDIAITAGLLYKLNPSVGLQIQFNYGLMDINNKPPNQLTLPFYPYLGNASRIYNRNLQLCLVF